MTNKCNMACKYCYAGSALEKFQDIKKLNEDFNSKTPVLFKFTDQLISYNKFTPTNFFFHGGEPLLINLENWEHILNYFREKNYPIKANVQTNGTLVNDDFINLFKKFNVSVGSSLDGPAFLNDKNRVFKNGEGSFLTVLKNIRKLKKAGLHIGCLVTLNKTNIKNIEAIYTLFKKYDIAFNVRPISETRYSLNKEILISPSEYATAFCKLFDIWFNDTKTKTFLINDFANIIARFIKSIEGLATCTTIKNCSGRFVSFDLDGNLWHCARFNGEDGFSYGNIKKDNLTNLLNSVKAKKFSERWKILSRKSCRNCKFSPYCYGGCPARAYYYYGSYFHKDYYCEAFKIILKHIYEKIKSTL